MGSLNLIGLKLRITWIGCVAVSRLREDQETTWMGLLEACNRLLERIAVPASQVDQCPNDRNHGERQSEHKSMRHNSTKYRFRS